MADTGVLAGDNYWCDFYYLYECVDGQFGVVHHYRDSYLCDADRDGGWHDEELLRRELTEAMPGCFR